MVVPLLHGTGVMVLITGKTGPVIIKKFAFNESQITPSDVVSVITDALHCGTEAKEAVGAVGGGAEANQPPSQPCPTVFPFSVHTTVKLPDGAITVGKIFTPLMLVNGPEISGDWAFGPS